MSWFTRLSLRARLMIIGVSGLAVALLLGGMVLLGASWFVVNRTLDDEAKALAAEVAAMVEEDRLPSPIPVSGSQLVQVVDGQGRVRSASLTADRLVPLLRPEELARARSGRAVEVSGSRAGLTRGLRVNAVPAGADGASTVIVARQVGDVQAARRTLRSALLVILPLLVGVLALIAWRVIGWTLRPVEALRTGAERISGGRERERLPVPAAADEIRALAITLNGMLDRLEAARERQRSFVADAAHELRSPLASMRTQLEVARHLGEAGTLPDELLIDLARLSSLVDDLLLLARADADQRAPVAREPVEIADLLAGVAKGVGSARATRPVPIRLGDIEPAIVEADRDELARAVTNLVDNAVRHAAGAVELGATATDEAVEITVDDDGPGIAHEDRERVFDRFARLDDARDRDAGGSGLGLAIARELVSRVGGTVSFADPPPGWSLRAVVRLPRAVVPAEGPRHGIEIGS